MPDNTSLLENPIQVTNKNDNSPIIDVQFKTPQNPAIQYIKSLGSDVSKENMRSRLKVFTAVYQQTIDSFPWHKLTRNFIVDFKDKLANAKNPRSGQPYSPATISHYLAALKGSAREAWRMNLMSDEVYRHINDIRGLRGSRMMSGREIIDHELAMVLNYEDPESSDLNNLRNQALMAITMSCGLRLSELASLTLASIKAKKFIKSGKSELGYLIRVVGKGNKERVVPIPPYFEDKLLQWLECWKNDPDVLYFIDDGYQLSAVPLFPRLRGSRKRDGRIYHRAELVELNSDETLFKSLKNITPRGLSKIIHQLSLKTSIDMSPHDFRRTYATRLLREGHDPAKVQALMGHSTMTTTMKYDMRNTEEAEFVARSFSL